MKKPVLTTPVVIVSLSILALLIISIVIVAAQHGGRTSDGARHTAAKVAKNPSAPKESSNSSPPAATPKASASPADQAVAANSAHAATDACKLLTLDVAKKALGNGVHSSGTGGTASLQANGTSVTACAFSSSSGSVQLIVRTPTDHLGVSENATAFGSGRPAGVSAVNGYGQAAYWDSAKHTLNILGDNNWYIISRDSGTQAAAEGVAKLLQTGF